MTKIGFGNSSLSLNSPNPGDKEQEEILKFVAAH